MGRKTQSQPKNPVRLRWCRAMRAKGYSLEKIGKVLEISKVAVSKYMNRWEKWE